MTDADDVVLGRVGLRTLDLHEACGEVGYWVMPEARGRGVAAAAVDLLARWLLDELGMHRLELRHPTVNAASCRVAERARFAVEGTARSAVRHPDGWHDMHVHARLADG